MRADIRIRIRGSVIRVRITEARIRTVIRITAEQDTARATNPLYVKLLNALYEGTLTRP